MNKISKNQNGFSLIEAILALGILVLLLVGGFLVYRHQHKATQAGPVTGKWATYTNAGADFSVLTPTTSTPNILPQTTQSHNGISFTLSGVTFRGDGVGDYQVTYSTFSNRAELPKPSVCLKGLLQPGKYLNDAHLISSKSTTISGNQAETYMLSLTRQAIKTGDGGSLPAEKLFYTGECVNSGKVAYEVNAMMANNSASDQADAQYFVNSFKILH